MADIQITPQDARDEKAFEVPSGAAHTFVLGRPPVRILELEDVNFHHNSAVIMPDYGVSEEGEVEDSDEDASGTDDQAVLPGLSAIVACLRYAKCETEMRLLVIGHTDTSGEPAYNLDLSRLRARATVALLTGDRDEWVEVCGAKSKTEDYQQILKWIARTQGFACDPGEVDGVHGSKTTEAVKGFQRSYNDWEDDSKQEDEIKVDGVVGRQTWGAIFDIYSDTLEVLLGVDEDAELQEYRDALQWVDDGNRFFGCGEHKPIEEPEKPNFRSETNRRVEMLFFKQDELPELPDDCDFSVKCDQGACQIYEKFSREYIFVHPCSLGPQDFRLVVELGRIEDLFEDAPDTPEGRMARLQTVGLFYFPLGHGQARNAFDGLAATAPNPGTGHPGDQAFTGAWDYFKADVVPGKSAASPASDAEADADIQKRLESFVVDGGTLPAAVEDGATPDTAKNSRKIRVPGGFTFVDALNGGLDTNRDPAYAMGMTGDQFAVEDLYYRDNPVLGKVPLVAKLEAKNPRTKQFEPLADASVYFQLVPADPLPAYDPTQPATAQVNRPAVRGSNQGGPADPAFTDSHGNPVPAEPAIPNQASGVGPLLRYTTEEARNADPDDPQGANCHSDRGGKRGIGSTADGSDVAGVLFETSSRKGFNEAHSGRELPHKPYPVAQVAAVDGDSHKHAVVAKTNEDGEAGVVFTPSRMGGDRYKLRIYLGPPTRASDGSEDEAVLFETGTFVMWRHLRLARYFQVVPGDPDPALLAEVNPTYGITSNSRYRRRVGVQNTPGLNTGNWSATEGSPAPQFAGPIIMWARAWCEFEIDRGALSGGSPLAVTTAQYNAARRQALADGIANQASVGASYNLPNLLYLEPGAPALTPATGLACVPMRTAEAYNAMPTTTAAQRIGMKTGAGAFGANATHQGRIGSLHLRILLRGFTRSLSQNGFLPGFVVIQSAMGCTWQIIGQNGDFSGIAINYRAGHLWYGNAVYTPANFPYGYDSNMIHEMGHCHYREHGPGRNPNPATPAGGNNQVKHDNLQTSICVMSYKKSEGDLCGMCNMGLRGWDIRNMTP